MLIIKFINKARELIKLYLIYFFKNKKNLNKEIKDENKDEENLEFENENEKNMEFIQNIQKEIDKENLQLKNELNDIQKEKNTLEENFYKSGDILKKKEEEEE